MELWLDDGNLDPALCSLQPESVVRAFVIGLWCISYSFRLVLLARSWNGNCCFHQHWLKFSQTPAALIQEKCPLLDKLGSLPKEDAGIESSWRILAKRKSHQNFRVWWIPMELWKEPILSWRGIFLIKELNEERSRHSRQEEMITEVTRIMWSLTWRSPHLNKLFQTIAPSLSL